MLIFNSFVNYLFRLIVCINTINSCILLRRLYSQSDIKLLNDLFRDLLTKASDTKIVTHIWMKYLNVPVFSSMYIKLCLFESLNDRKRKFLFHGSRYDILFPISRHINISTLDMSRALSQFRILHIDHPTEFRYLLSAYLHHYWLSIKVTIFIIRRFITVYFQLKIVVDKFFLPFSNLAHAIDIQQDPRNSIFTDYLLQI